MVYICTACKMRYDNLELFKIHVRLYHKELENMLDRRIVKNEYIIPVRLDRTLYNYLLSIKSFLDSGTDIPISSVIKLSIMIANYILSKGYTLDDIAKLEAKNGINRGELMNDPDR